MVEYINGLMEQYKAKPTRELRDDIISRSLAIVNYHHPDLHALISQATKEMRDDVQKKKAELELGSVLKPD